MPTPEELARIKIDQLLEAAGWTIQDMAEFNRNAALGVAVREFSLPDGPCDYLLFVSGKAEGVVEAKKEGHTLSGVADQSEKYMAKLPDGLARWDNILLFDYESTGTETFFRNMKDPTPRSRRLFAFHKPETLHDWLKMPDTLRARMTNMPPLDTAGLRDCQVEAIEGLEVSLSGDNPRSLIQMATGAGKTFTACNFSYRLLKHAKAKRILFLVDRNNLGRQTLREFQNFKLPDDGRQFDKVHIIQHLSSNRVQKDAEVVITTIQRLFSMLKGEELEPEEEELSAFEVLGDEEGVEQTVEYNPDIPIEFFNFIVTDECHRSIYGLWRQVLEYFDAHIIGLTATPSQHTLGFFGRNIVCEYPYERSVADGVNVGYEIFRIRTRIGEQGSRVDAGYTVGVRDRRTRKTRYEELDSALSYNPDDLDRSVTAPNQIRTIIQAYRDHLFTDLFPGRDWVPKTLIFAKDDNHAEEIVHIVREVFEQGNDFCKKITYRTTGDKPEELIKTFRVDPMPRVTVTVDMIATGTDVKPIEVLIFMRDVKSELYFEQMKGRGVRSISDTDLKQVTPDAETKTRFVLIDAVGVTETIKTTSQPLERKRTVSFDKLIDQIAMGKRDDDALSSLAGRLAALDKEIDAEDQARIAVASGGRTLSDLANGLLDAVDPDVIEARVAAEAGPSPTQDRIEEVVENIKNTACAPFDNPVLRQTIKDIRRKSLIVIDEVSTDEVVGAEYDANKAEERTDTFRKFIEDNKDAIEALEIIYHRRYGEKRLTYKAIQDLHRILADPPYFLKTAELWQAYRRINQDKVRQVRDPGKLLTNIVSLVRYAIGHDDELEPFEVHAEQRFNLWIGRKIKAGQDFTEEQTAWLRLIKDHIAANVEIVPQDLTDLPSFADNGGLIKARALFGGGLDEMLSELNGALVA